jgi:hypothetical protein
LNFLKFKTTADPNTTTDALPADAGTNDSNTTTVSTI